MLIVDSFFSLFFFSQFVVFLVKCMPIIRKNDESAARRCFFARKKTNQKPKGNQLIVMVWIIVNKSSKTPIQVEFFLEWYAINYLFFRLWCCYKSSNVQRSCSRVQSKNCKGKFWCPDKHFSFNSIFHDEFPEICRVNRTIKALERRIQPAGNFSYSFLSQQ